MTTTLSLVGDADAIRESVDRFNERAPTSPYARQLVRATSYWVYDATEETFGPSKFVGFAGMDSAGYDRALRQDFEGVQFNGHLTRSAIEEALGLPFVEHLDLPSRLRAWAESLFGPDVFDGIEESKWRFVVVPERFRAPGLGRGRGQRIWALFANPAVYRIEDALRVRTEDTWVTGGRDIRVGDRAIFWRGLGRDGKRGVVALGEVLSDPQEWDDSDNPFWTEKPQPKPELRVRVRYSVPSAMPLWLDEHPEVLGALSVSRARGGTVFNVEDDQWEALARLARVDAGSPKVGSVGAPYRIADESVSMAARDPFDVDPDRVDRGNHAHRATQNALAAFLREHGIEPRSPGASDPDADLLWESEATTFVAEVKSLTAANEEKQLRLGLGQVLRYRQMLAGPSRQVVAVLVPECAPADFAWASLCAELGVRLVWPRVFERLLSRHGDR